MVVCANDGGVFGLTKFDNVESAFWVTQFVICSHVRLERIRTGTHSSQMSNRSLVPFCRLSQGDAFSDSSE